MLRTVFLCILTVFLISCGSSNMTEKSVTDDDSDTTTEVSQAVHSGRTLSDCEQESITVVRVACYTEVALSENDETICAQIKEPVTGMNNCYNELAQAKKDPGICEMIEGSQVMAICLSRLGAKMGDCHICDRIDDAIWANQCKEACRKN
jgi:hypothetical protein